MKRKSCVVCDIDKYAIAAFREEDPNVIAGLYSTNYGDKYLESDFLGHSSLLGDKIDNVVKFESLDAAKARIASVKKLMVERGVRFTYKAILMSKIENGYSNSGNHAYVVKSNIRKNPVKKPSKRVYIMVSTKEGKDYLLRKPGKKMNFELVTFGDTSAYSAATEAAAEDMYYKLCEYAVENGFDKKFSFEMVRLVG